MVQKTKRRVHRRREAPPAQNPQSPPPPTQEVLSSEPLRETGDGAPVEVIEVNEITGAEDPVFQTQPLEPAAVEDPLLSEDEFFETFFCAGFFTAGVALGQMYPPTWQSLIDAPEDPGARKASNALYRIAKRHSFMHWMIERDTMWMADYAVVGMFAVRVGKSVYAEASNRGLIESQAIPKDARGEALRAHEEGAVARA